MTDAFVLGGVRTPVGRYGGGLSHIRTDDLLGQTMVAACERALATELRLREAQYGVAEVCVGSGQGVATVLENPNAG